MKEIIPLKKDIIFKTKIGEITNINLDYDYNIKDNLLEGYVIVYGTYKMTVASVIDEEFSYKIPFSISLTKGIVKDSIKIEIDDFKYNISKDILSVNVDLEFLCDEKESKNESDILNEIKEEEINDIINENIEDNSIVNNIENEKEININQNDNSIDIDENINNITNTIINNDNNYYTYKVYIVRNNDTIEQICSKFNITLDELKEYNDIKDIKLGDKIIIPYINE